MRRPVRVGFAVGGCGLAVAAIGWTALGLGGDDGTATAAPAGPPGTAKVVRTTLVRTETVQGSLGYGDAAAVSVANRAGTITWVPGEGARIERGEAVYAVDAVKVPLLYGSTPLYRALGPGSSGKDVRMLERNLAELGYDGFTVDDDYTGGTADAVRDWQNDLGREETGTVARGDAVVAGGARRVADVRLAMGDTAAGAVLTWTGTARLVSVDLEVEFEDLVAEGTKARIGLPDGSTAEAEVTAIGTAAEPGQGENGAVKEATVPVELTVADPGGLGRYQAAPVDVTLAAETRKDVLAVPVTALVALREGGYAVEAVEAAGTRRLRVETGVFAGGLVEVSGAGLAAGLTVGTPR